jgi:hypothetical protein
MDVIVNELTSTVEVTSEETLLDPAVLRRVVEAVSVRLRDAEAAREWEARERRPDRPPGR